MVSSTGFAVAADMTTAPARRVFKDGVGSKIITTAGLVVGAAALAMSGAAGPVTQIVELALTGMMGAGYVLAAKEMSLGAKNPQRGFRHYLKPFAYRR